MKSSPNKQASAHIELILELYTLIPSSYKITLGELHQKLLLRGIHRSTRTVQRSLDIITHYFDVEKDERSKPYGYRKMQTDRVRLKAKEAVMLKLVSHCLKPLLPKDIASAFEPAIHDAEHYLISLSDDYKESVWLSCIHFNDNQIPPFAVLSSDAFLSINEALYHRRQVKVSTFDKPAPKTVSPLGIIFNHSGCEVVVRDEMLDCQYSILLSEILSIEPSTFTFSANPAIFHDWLTDNNSTR